MRTPAELRQRFSVHDQRPALRIAPVKLILRYGMLETLDIHTDKVPATANANLASRGGVEPPTFPLGGGCSIQLSYRDVTGFFNIKMIALHGALTSPAIPGGAFGGSNFIATLSCFARKPAIPSLGWRSRLMPSAHRHFDEAPVSPHRATRMKKAKPGRARLYAGNHLKWWAEGPHTPLPLLGCTGYQRNYAPNYAPIEGG
jgi:hypothetical protein